MRLVGCHKVAVPRLNEYKVPILPQVQCSVVSPFHRPSAVSCAQVYSTFNHFFPSLEYGAHRAIHVPSIQPSHMFPTSHQAPPALLLSIARIRPLCRWKCTVANSHKSAMPITYLKYRARLVSALRESFRSLLFLETEWVSRDHPFNGVTSYIIIVLGYL
ncbi:hypothetical protein B0H14DRAFT_3021501 [Mycena olivaceomarginata]|nr:hypothetical protein B0H14DRAFT_3021501 [Mycena olivaceomarginata]